LAFFPSAFLTRRSRNALIILILSLVLSLVLGLGRGSASDRKGKNQENGDTTTRRAEGELYGSQAADPG